MAKRAGKRARTSSTKSVVTSVYKTPKYARSAKKWTAGRSRTSGLYGRFPNTLAPELKFFDTTISFNVDATGEVPATGQLNIIPQGDGPSDRDGRKCLIKSISLKLKQALVIAASATPVSAFTKIFLILDTQCNGAAATAADVFTQTNFTISHTNVANSQRFRILKIFKGRHHVTGGATTAYATSAPIVHDYYKKVNIPIVWDNTAITGSVATTRSNNLFLMASSGTGQGTNDDLVTVEGECRLRFQG